MTVVDTAEEVFERIDDAFFALDDEWRFTFLNERAEEVLDVDRRDVIGEVVWDEFEAAVDTTFQAEYERAMATQEPVSFEEYYPPLETWFEVTAYPGEEGLSVYFRDVTDRVERERELERYESIVETVQDGIYVVDSEGRFQMVNEAYADMLGYSRGDLIGADVSTVVDDETAERAAELERELASGGRDTATLEATLYGADGETLEAEATFALLPHGDRVGVVRDVTDRVERERELERVRDLLDRAERIADVGGWEIDAETMEVFWTDHLFALLGIDADGEPSIDEALDVYHEDDRPIVADAVEAAIDDGESFDEEVLFRRPDGEVRWLRVQGVPRPGDGEVAVVRGAAQDVTERKRFERRLVDLHRVARNLLWAKSDQEIAEIATDALHEIVGAPAAGLYAYDPDEELLRPDVVSDSAGLVPADLPAVPPGDESITGAVFEQGESRVVDELRDAPQFNDPDGDLDVRSGVFVPVSSYGVLSAVSPDPGAFDDRTRQLVEIVATAAAAAFTRVERERMLRNRRDRLSALSDIDSLVHGLAASVFGLSSRAEIEQQVCDSLADSDSYEFAWIGTVEAGEVTADSEAGVEGYLDDIRLALDELPGESGPTARAHQTGEMQIVRDVETDPGYEPWRERAREYGYRASASVPIRRDAFTADGDATGPNDSGDVRATLNVYTGREDAFSAEERNALRRLGSIIAYAFRAVERDRELQRERNRLEFMNRLLRHNLLNSLNVVDARLDLIEGRVDYEVASHLDTAAARTEEMIDFVRTIRDATRAIGESGDQNLEPVALRPVVEERVERARATRPAAEYRVESVPDVDVVADDLLGEVLDNVVTNAVQHNPSDEPTVRIETTVDDGTVEVAVADDGPGIPDEEKATVFDREENDFEDPDSGFGLYLVKEIMESYGGDVAIEDNAPEGTVVRLTFERA